MTRITGSAMRLGTGTTWRSAPGSASRSPLRISSAAAPRRRATASTESATAARLLAKMSAQIVGLEPATRVVSRKLGPTSGSRSESRASSAAASLASALATTWGRWLIVASRRSWAAGSIACGRAPSAETSRCRRS